MPARERAQMLERRKAIAAEPGGRHPGVTTLQGTEGGMRVRQGDWRAIFLIEDGDVVVDAIGHRREVDTMSRIKPIAESTETVTLARADFEALLIAAENAVDAAAFNARRARR